MGEGEITGGGRGSEFFPGTSWDRRAREKIPAEDEGVNSSLLIVSVPNRDSASNQPWRNSPIHEGEFGGWGVNSPL